MKFKKGELSFYKKHNPRELKKIYKQFPENRNMIEYFCKIYEYSWVQKKWTKRRT